ncbi:thioredoxin family protein [Legionella hackeliae]|uniref:Putative Thioredoxin-like protein n=1 Tax=Legionella hackeliae TaxID=449 RepID=A0A0A8UV10_LEGHA|nr:thioredoxin family protein [Legionella hackeliae]KTD13891.1 putative thiol-disulfide isomerase [Legionella hackeliae]CEK10594.1 putative Thioredoxin-like protein [Legionella hackeliae]STX47336.1 putative thiol-disulfide isomerase and thioredoxins family [Legionella hackeliae]
MAKTPSNMVPLGTPAQQFSLMNVVDNSKVNFNDNWDSKATVIMFICNHCPYVRHISHALTKLAQDYLSKGVSFLAINSNDVEAYPADSPENMKKIALEQNYPFPYLYDETQEVAKAYQAACTPDFYIFDSDLLLAYRGQFDDSRPGNDIAVTGSDIRQALDNLLAKKPISTEQKPSLGCNIKWKN